MGEPSNEKKREDLDFEIRFYERLIKDKPDFIDALIPLADAYTKRGHYDKGLEIDKQLAGLCPEDGGVFYNLACSYSLTGQKEDALQALKHAIKLGYSDVDHLLRDDDLDNIRKDPRFQKILEKIKQQFD